MGDRLSAEREAEIRRYAATSGHPATLMLEDLQRELDAVRNPEYLDAPTGDGWYWILPTDADRTSQYADRFNQPRKVEKIYGLWYVSIPNIGGGGEDLDGRRVAPCTGRPAS